MSVHFKIEEKKQFRNQKTIFSFFRKVYQLFMDNRITLTRICHVRVLRNEWASLLTT
jgi:hypothetical protein